MDCNILRIIQLNIAINSSPIRVFNVSGEDITNESMYSWSSDGVCWTGWTSYDKYITITKNLESDFYLRILIRGSFGDLVVNNCLFKDYTISLFTQNTFISDPCAGENLFQPYSQLDCALLLQQQLSDGIICMFGLPIYYIKVSPVKESSDYTFKEYVLHGIETIKQIKLMIPDGQLPSSNPKITEFDFDWENDWEVEIGKSQFAAAFGDTVIPQQRDLVYIPMMSRMWEVNSAYDEKNEGLMWRSTTWKLSLVKYNEKTNVDHKDFGDIIDTWIESKTYDNVFGEMEKNEKERETSGAPLTSPAFSATNLYDIFMSDAVREKYTKDSIDVLNKIYCHRSNVVARNIYKFKSLDAGIVYQKEICGENGVLMFMIETGGNRENVENVILKFGNIEVLYKCDNNKISITYNSLVSDLQSFNTYLVILKWNHSNFTTEMDVYPYTHPDDVPIYKLKPEMYYFDFNNPVTSLVGSYNNDFNHLVPQKCIISGYPCMMSNIKYFNTIINSPLDESIKYTTTNPYCVINDLARPVVDGRGYVVK